MQSILDWLDESSSPSDMQDWEWEAMRTLQPYAKAIQGALTDEFLDELTSAACAAEARAEHDAFVRGFRLGAGLLLELGWSRRDGGPQGRF